MMVKVIFTRECELPCACLGPFLLVIIIPYDTFKNASNVHFLASPLPTGTISPAICLNLAIDVLFVIDNSGHMGSAAFNQVLEFSCKPIQNQQPNFTDQKCAEQFRRAIQHSATFNKDSNGHIRQHCHKSIYFHQGQESDTISSWRHCIALHRIRSWTKHWWVIVKNWMQKQNSTDSRIAE